MCLNASMGQHLSTDQPKLFSYITHLALQGPVIFYNFDFSPINIPYYRKTSNISRTLVGNKIVDNSDVVGASPVGAAPTTSSCLSYLQIPVLWRDLAGTRHRPPYSVCSQEVHHASFCTCLCWLSGHICQCPQRLRVAVPESIVWWSRIDAALFGCYWLSGQRGFTVW